MEIGKITRPAKKLIEGFRQLATSTIGNALDDLQVSGVIQNIKPICTGFHFAGGAVTVKEVTGVLGTYTNADFTLGQVIDSAQEGDVIVIDNGGQQVSTWGGIAAFAAKKRGVAGLVVDGGVRDLDEIREFDFPVFSRHVVPTSGKGRVKLLSMNTVVKIDGIRVRPGDIMVGDGTGIICVPIEIAEDVLTMAKKMDEQDKQGIEEIRRGLSFTEALRKFAKI
ncbi:MAG TPA: RraA family protein [Thermodesulfobacteriota bacterium]|nr:RraA family protein [Thermodesulfobacteriota bacterium]